MAQFDFSAWKEHKWAYAVIIIVTIAIIVYIHINKMKESKGQGVSGRKPCDGNGEAYYYGRGSKEDSIPELLDRIDWSSYLEKRTILWYRVGLMTLIASAIVIIFVLKKLPTPPAIIMLFLSIFIPFYAAHQLHYVHGDIYNDYYIKKNVELLRRKLGYRKEHPTEPKCRVPARTTVMNPK